MVSFKDCGLQTRLYMLVFAAVVPVFGAVAVHAVQDRREALEQAGRDLQKLAHAIAFDYRLLVDNDRQFLSASSDVPQNFRKAVANRDSVASAVRVNRTPSAASIDLGLPNAPAANAVSMAWIAESLGRVRLPESAQLLLLGRDGMVISRYAGAVGASAKSFADPSLYRNLPQQPEHGFTHVYGAGDAAQLIGFAPLSSNGDRSGARVLIAMPLAAAYAEPQRRLSWNLGFLTGMTLLMFAAVRWFGSRWVLQPVDALTRAVERFGGGDLSARTGLSHDAGELGRLARGVDALVERAERQAAEQYRSEEGARRLHRGYMLFTSVNHAIGHQRDRTALLRELCRVLVDEGGFALAWVGWAEPGVSALHLVAHHGPDPQQLFAGTSIPSDGSHPGLRAVRERRVVVCNDIDNTSPGEPWRTFAFARGHRAWAAFPLTVEGRIVGSINLHASHAGAFDAEEQRLLVEVASDISFALDTMLQEQQRYEAEKRLTFIAYHDPVTELPNLLHYDELMKGLHERAHLSMRPFALMIVGIERLQEVAATFGYNMEGELLRLIGQRLRQCTRVGDVLARGASNNFNLVFPDTDADMLLRTTQHVLKIMQQPFAIQGMDIELGVAIGIALFPDHGEKPEVLNRCAYTALAQARKTGSGHVLYSPGQESFTPERLALVSELRNAIDHDHLALAYQPKVNLIDGSIAGVEALIRWTHPVRGVVPPEYFIQVAEQTGLIRSLTDWVIEMVTRQSHQFTRAGYRLPIALNLSTLNLIDPHLPARLYNHCLAWNVDPTAIELEITESSLMQDPTGSLQVLRRLSETGYLLYIDDFGTGYSSLAYLKKLSVDALKIDKSFVLDMMQDHDAHQIVRSTIDLAHDLGLKVVAEGVESQEALARLRTLGCDMVQGSHIAPPMNVGELLEWLASASWHTSPASAHVLPRGSKHDSSAPKGARKKIL